MLKHLKKSASNPNFIIRDRELETKEIQSEETNARKKLENYLRDGNFFFSNMNYYKAKNRYSKYIEAVKLIEYEKSFDKEELNDVKYKLSLSLFHLHEIEKAEPILKEILECAKEEDLIYADVLNLLSLIYFKLEEFLKTKNLLEKSLKLNPDQPYIKIIYLYLNKNYDLVLRHAPYDLIRGEVPFVEHNSIVPESLLLKIYAQCCMDLGQLNYDKAIVSLESDESTKQQSQPNYAKVNALFKADNRDINLSLINYGKAIALFEAAIFCLPKLPSYAIERAHLYKLCGDAYKKLSKLGCGKLFVIKGVMEFDQKEVNLKQIEVEERAKRNWELGLQEIYEARLIKDEKNNQVIFGEKLEEIEKLEVDLKKKLNILAKKEGPEKRDNLYKFSFGNGKEPPSINCIEAVTSVLADDTEKESSVNSFSLNNSSAGNGG